MWWWWQPMHFPCKSWYAWFWTLPLSQLEQDWLILKVWLFKYWNIVSIPIGASQDIEEVIQDHAAHLRPTEMLGGDTNVHKSHKRSKIGSWECYCLSSVASTSSSIIVIFLFSFHLGTSMEALVTHSLVTGLYDTSSCKQMIASVASAW